MSKLTKAEQARVNGAKSTGPITPEGKKRSSLNAVRHGILAQQVCLTMEKPAEYLEMLQDFLTRFQPVDGVELRLVEEMVNCSWRLERCHAIETALFDNEMDTMTQEIKNSYKRTDLITVAALGFKSMADKSKALALYLRYEAAAIRQFDRVYKLLLSLREKVPAAETETELPEVPQTDEATHPEELPNEPNAVAETPEREPIHRE